MEKQFQFKKKYGQNFIRDSRIVEHIAFVSQIRENALVIEIGPGSGMLTKELAKLGQPVLAYEIDTSLRDTLSREFQNCSHVNIIYDDFLHRDLKEDLKPYTYDFLYVVANLPYYITTPIISKIIEDGLDVLKMVLMVQKEVGDRFCAQVKTKDYSSLTVFLHYYFEVKKEFLVGRDCFIPRPNVDSVVVSFTKREQLLELSDSSFFFQFVRDSFQFKRKTLRNNLKNYHFSVIEEALHTLGHGENVRAEELSLEDFVFLSNYYCQHH